MKQLDTKLMHPADQITVVISRIYRSGLTTTSGGNISIKDENGDIWITPGGIDKGSLTPKDIICVKPDGTIVPAEVVDVTYDAADRCYVITVDHCSEYVIIIQG